MGFRPLIGVIIFQRVLYTESVRDAFTVSVPLSGLSSFNANGVADVVKAAGVVFVPLSGLSSFNRCMCGDWTMCLRFRPLIGVIIFQRMHQDLKIL